MLRFQTFLDYVRSAALRNICRWHRFTANWHKAGLTHDPGHLHLGKAIKRYLITTETDGRKRLYNFWIHCSFRCTLDSLKVKCSRMKQLPQVNMVSGGLCQENEEWVKKISSQKCSGTTRSTIINTSVNIFAHVATGFDVSFPLLWLN